MILRPLKSLAKTLYGKFPEGRLKHTVRAVPLSFLSALPRRAFINPGDCALQIGTPSPLTVHYILDIVGPEGRVIVVEPEEENIRKLGSDERIAAASNVVLVQKAAWSRREILSFTVSKNGYDHKVAIPGIVHDNDFVEDNYTGTQSVQADTVDNILEELNVVHVDYAEVHVNGAEIEVLKGMEKSLDIISRIHLKGHSLDSETNKPINEALVDMLRKRGFITKIAAGSQARNEAIETGAWQRRAGDVFGAKW